jgi:hypothetical protein
MLLNVARASFGRGQHRPARQRRSNSTSSTAFESIKSLKSINELADVYKVDVAELLSNQECTPNNNNFFALPAAFGAVPV